MNEMATMKVRVGGKWVEAQQPVQPITQKCHAWISFDGTGTPSPYGSFNISRIQDSGVGNYWFYFNENAGGTLGQYTYYSAIASGDLKQSNSQASSKILPWVPDGGSYPDKVSVRFYAARDIARVGDPKRASLMIYQSPEEP